MKSLSLVAPIPQRKKGNALMFNVRFLGLDFCRPSFAPAKASVENVSSVTGGEWIRADAGAVVEIAGARRERMAELVGARRAVGC